jgi:hypothetical protein
VFEEVGFGEFGWTVGGVITLPGSNEKATGFKDTECNIISLTNTG